MMPEEKSLVQQFSELSDPRASLNQRHKFIDVVVIAVCAATCGADDWISVEQFGQAKVSWFRQLLELPNGIPSHDTFWRVFRHLDGECFERCFSNWVFSLRQVLTGELIAVDGKQRRRSHDGSEGKAAIQLISAWVVDQKFLFHFPKTNTTMIGIVIQVTTESVIARPVAQPTVQPRPRHPLGKVRLLC
jgi:hypothetical protein